MQLKSWMIDGNHYYRHYSPHNGMTHSSRLIVYFI